MKLICPFVERDCVEDRCAGWINGTCFVIPLSSNTSRVIPSITETKLAPDKAHLVTSSAIHPSPHITKRPIHPDISLGLDFGTAYCKVTLRFKDGAPEPLKVGDQRSGEALRQYCFPSVIYISDVTGRLYFGADAEIKLQEERAIDRGCRLVRSFKRALLTGHSEFVEHGRWLPPDQLAAFLIAALLQRVDVELEKKYGLYCYSKNYTVPVQFLDGEARPSKRVRRAIVIAEQLVEHLRQEPAPQLTNLQKLYEALDNEFDNLPAEMVSQNLSEPNAAAWEVAKDPLYAYGHYCLIDSGAGTTDITFFEKRSGPVPIAIGASIGLDLGGSDIDNCVEELIAEKLRTGYSYDLNSQAALFDRLSLEQAKREIKEKVLTQEVGVFSTEHNQSVSISLQELLDSPGVMDFAKQVDATFTAGLKQARNKFGAENFNKDLQRVYMIGGTAKLLMANGLTTNLRSKPIWTNLKNTRGQIVAVESLEASQELKLSYPGIEQIYPLVAISIGASWKKLPKEVLPEGIIEPPKPVPKYEQNYTRKEDV